MMGDRELVDLMQRAFFADYLYRQLSEECCELSQAALKMVRRMMDETPESARSVLEHYVEELADVKIMWDLAVANMNDEQVRTMNSIMEQKRQRMEERMMGKINPSAAEPEDA